MPMSVHVEASTQGQGSSSTTLPPTSSLLLLELLVNHHVQFVSAGVTGEPPHPVCFSHMGSEGLTSDPQASVAMFYHQSHLSSPRKGKFHRQDMDGTRLDAHLLVQCIQ